jgi:AraC-like DNA-binding protein
VRRHFACRPRRKRQLSEVASPGVTGDASIAGTGRVLERRRAVALARHYCEAEGPSIAQVADRLGRSSATVKAYFYDPSEVTKRL